MTPDRFEELAREVWTPVQSYLRRRTDPTTAEDVLGDVLLVLWRRRADVPPEGVLPWAYAVARGCLANARRGEERRLHLVTRLGREPSPPAYDEGLGEDDADLASALRSLPPRDQEVLRLWAWEGLAPREIAVVLCISANAASIRLHRATAKLRKELGATGQEQHRQGEEAPR